MISYLSRLGSKFQCLMAVLVVCLLPAVSSAESIRLQNKTNEMIIVQTACVVANVVRKGPTFQLKPDDATPPIILPGNKVITIIDPRMPARVLFQGTIGASIEDQSFNIIPDIMPPRLKIEPRRRP